MTMGSSFAFGEQRAAKAGGKLHYSRTRDIDEQAALLRGWNQTYTQMSSGAFAGSIADIAFAGTQLFLEETSSALYQVGGLPRGQIAIGLPIKCSGLATFCGAPCEGAAVHVFSGRDGFEFHTPGGLIMSGIVIADSVLAEALTPEEHEAVLQSLAYAHLRRVTEDQAHSLRQQLAGIFQVLGQQPQFAGNDAQQLALKQVLVSNVAHVLAGGMPMDEPLIAPDRRWQIVAAARDLIFEHPDTPVTVAGLCRSLGVSRRSLQYCFQDVMGLGPAAFLRSVRLDGARRALKSAQSVTEAATLWGFWHFGRFAQDYKTMFGELPSETFRRHHSNRHHV